MKFIECDFCNSTGMMYADGVEFPCPICQQDDEEDEEEIEED